MILPSSAITGPGQCCWQPNDIAIGPDGNVYIAEGHGTNPNDRVMVFSPEGKFIREFGTRGDGPGQFNQPHALAFDSQGRLFVGDRGNNRVQIFDRNLNHVATWYQFSRPSGLFIDRNDNLYSADSESGNVKSVLNAEPAAPAAALTPTRIGTQIAKTVIHLCVTHQRASRASMLARLGEGCDCCQWG